MPSVQAGFYELHLLCDCESGALVHWREVSAEGRLLEPGHPGGFDLCSGDVVMRPKR